MENQKLVERLRAKAEEARSLRNGPFHISETISNLLYDAADSMENLQTENAALRRHIDNLTSAQATVAKEFLAKLEELHETKSELERVKAERDAVLVLIRGDCSYCKHWLNMDLNDANPCLKCEHFAVRERIKGDFWELGGQRKEGA